MLFRFLLKCPLTCRLSSCTGSGGGYRNLSISVVTHSKIYEQGQYDGKIREYFYFIDHQGMLFLDDSRMKNFTSCFKDPVFLAFFHRNIKKKKESEKERYPTFPYISLCGIERNYLKCDDLPVVFTHLFKTGDEDRLGYGYYTGDKLSVKFQPEKLLVDANGRIYHPTEFVDKERKVSVGLVRSGVGSDILSEKFVFEKGQPIPVGIRWENKLIMFDNSNVVDLLNKERSI